MMYTTSYILLVITLSTIPVKNPDLHITVSLNFLSISLGFCFFGAVFAGENGVAVADAILRTDAIKEAVSCALDTKRCVLVVAVAIVLFLLLFLFAL